MSDEKSVRDSGDDQNGRVQCKHGVPYPKSCHSCFLAWGAAEDAKAKASRFGCVLIIIEPRSTT